MNTCRRLAALTVILTCSSFAQQLRNEEIDLPLPISSPRAIDPGTIEPLTAEQKMQRAVRNTFGWRALANRALIAGYHQWLDHPEEWPQGMEGYGKRFGSRMGRLAVRNAVQLSTDVAFGLDPRYDRCSCSGFWSRTKHAWKRVVIARRDNGSETISVSHFAGAYIPPMITYHWYPDRYNTMGKKLEAGTEFLALRGATNMLREFWPDIARKLKLKK